MRWLTLLEIFIQNRNPLTLTEYIAVMTIYADHNTDISLVKFSYILMCTN